jgi:hypothetical protein
MFSEIAPSLRPKQETSCFVRLSVISFADAVHAKAVKRMKRIAEEKFVVFIMSVFFFQQSNDIYFKQINLLPLMNDSFSVSL